MAAHPDRSKRLLGRHAAGAGVFSRRQRLRSRGRRVLGEGEVAHGSDSARAGGRHGGGRFVTKAITNLMIEIQNGARADRVTVSTGRESRTLVMKPAEVARLNLAVEDGVPYHRAGTADQLRLRRVDRDDERVRAVPRGARRERQPLPRRADSSRPRLRRQRNLRVVAGAAGQVTIAARERLRVERRRLGLPRVGSSQLASQTLASLPVENRRDASRASQGNHRDLHIGRVSRGRQSDNRGRTSVIVRRSFAYFFAVVGAASLMA